MPVNQLDKLKLNALSTINKSLNTFLNLALSLIVSYVDVWVQSKCSEKRKMQCSCDIFSSIGK